MCFVFKFLFDIVFSLFLLESELLLIGSFRLDQEKSLLVSAFFIFNGFWGVWNWYLLFWLVLPVLLYFLLPNGFGFPTLFLWSSRIILMIAFLDLVSLFKKLIWLFMGFISIFLSSQCADVSQYFDFYYMK